MKEDKTMIKKQYIQPTCEVILLKASHPLLAGSFGDSATPTNVVFGESVTEDNGTYDPE